MQLWYHHFHLTTHGHSRPLQQPLISVLVSGFAVRALELSVIERKTRLHREFSHHSMIGFTNDSWTVRALQDRHTMGTLDVACRVSAGHSDDGEAARKRVSHRRGAHKGRGSGGDDRG